MKLLKLLTAAIIGSMVAASCNSEPVENGAQGYGTVKVGNHVWENIGFIYKPSLNTDECVTIWLVPKELNNNTTSSWVKYYPKETDKDRQVAFQLPDFDYPARGYVQNWQGTIAPAGNNTYTVKASGTSGNDSVSFTGIAIAKE